MFYITSFNRFGNKYTQQNETKPLLQPRHGPRDLIRYLDSLPEIPIEYSQFRIPKTSGGYRTITAPSEELKRVQRYIVDYLQGSINILESSWAYAYVKNTCAIDALKLHQKNHSEWFLKIDIKDFFPSCTQEVVEQSLKQIYPICSWPEEAYQKFINNINKYCFYQGCLPQGAVSSPLLSNLTLTPFDFKIHKMLQKAGNFKKQRYVFTRYADDIIISAKNQFEWRRISNAIQEIFGSSFKLKAKKTRYGSNHGRNWNLGCMLNKDNDITIGFRQKEEWKRKMMDIIVRYSNQEPISIHEKQELLGKLAYYKMIEPDYFNYLNNHYLQKYHQNFEEILKH